MTTSRYEGLQLIDGDVAYKDFDSAWNAQSVGSLRITVKERVINLPVEMPASLILYHLRVGENVEQDPEEIPKWLASIIGQDEVDALLKAGITWSELNELTMYLLRFYGIIADSMAEQKEGGEEAAPKG